MVISFQLENVRKYLLENGVVYTFRSKPHKQGRDWANSGRGTKKIADVDIIEYPLGYPPDYYKQSGFETPVEWINNYCKLNHDPDMKKAHLFRVQIVPKMVPFKMA